MLTVLNRLLLENMHKSTINSCQQLQIHSLPEALAFCKNEDKIINVQKLPAELKRIPTMHIKHYPMNMDSP